MTVTTAVAGALFLFLRWLQMQNVMQGVAPDALVARSSPYNIAVLLAMVCAVLLAVFFTLRQRKGLTAPSGPAALGFGGAAYTALSVAVCALLLIGAVLLLAKGSGSQKFLGFLLLFSDAAIARLTLGKNGASGKYFRAVCAAFVTVVMSVWIIFDYKANAENPQLWLFAPAILAFACSALGFYYLAGYSFGRAKPARTLLVSQLATYFCLIAAAYPGTAQGTAGQTLVFVALALFFLLEAWSAAGNLYFDFDGNA